MEEMSHAGHQPSSIPVKQKITEEDQLHIEWFDQAKVMTLDCLPIFLAKLVDDYEHDYGTICLAITAAAIAAARAVNNSSQGGISGHQAGAVMWTFIQEWLSEKNPMKLVKFERMLFPQYEYHFDKLISADTWQWLQEEARKHLAKNDPYLSAAVELHWRSIAQGAIPFGYKLEVKENA